MKKNLLFLACIFALLSVSCSDDEPKDGDKTKAPSKTEFQTKVEGKIWTQDNGEDVTWITNDGKSHTWEDLEPVSGASYQDSYYFKDSDATIFVLNTFGGDSPRAKRYDYTYTYDEKTGEVKFMSDKKQNGAIVIESVTADRLVIRDQQGCNRLENCAYRRVVMKPVAQDEMASWWDTYIPA